MRDPSVLVTGADGYLGRFIVDEYLRRTDKRLVLWVRSANPGDFAAKVTQLTAEWPQHVHRLQFAFGDLRSLTPFWGVDAAEIAEIVHAAATTNFAVDRMHAERVNVDGTRKMLAFARRCPRLRCFGYLSSLYATGLQQDEILEVPAAPDADFANHYEWSKNRAEHVIVSTGDDLPWRIFRVATVIADDETGRVGQRNAFHNTMRLLRHGLLSICPGHPTTPLYFANARAVASSITRLMDATNDRSIFHLSHDGDRALSLEALIDLCFDVFRADVEFVRRRILKPLFCDARSFRLLRDGVAGSEVLGDALESVDVFVQQLYVNKRVRNHNLRAANLADGFPVPRELLRRTCEHLVLTQWNKESVSCST